MAEWRNFFLPSYYKLAVSRINCFFLVVLWPERLVYSALLIRPIGAMADGGLSQFWSEMLETRRPTVHIHYSELVVFVSISTPSWNTVLLEPIKKKCDIRFLAKSQDYLTHRVKKSNNWKQPQPAFVLLRWSLRPRAQPKFYPNFIIMMSSRRSMSAFQKVLTHPLYKYSM
jgi:hypothetical protein